MLFSQSKSICKGAISMISYDKLHKRLEDRCISTYVLRFEWGIASDTVRRLKRNKPVSTVTLDRLCNHLNCNIEDIVEHIPDKGARK